jgi:hypothetical protein
MQLELLLLLMLTLTPALLCAVLPCRSWMSISDMLLLLVLTFRNAPICCCSCAVQELNERQSPDSSLGLNLRIMVVGMTGTGEVGSQLHALRHKGNQMSIVADETLSATCASWWSA